MAEKDLYQPLRPTTIAPKSLGHDMKSFNSQKFRNSKKKYQMRTVDVDDDDNQEGDQIQEIVE